MPKPRILRHFLLATAFLGALGTGMVAAQQAQQPRPQPPRQPPDVRQAQQISIKKFKNPTAVFAGLDKITGRIIAFEAAVDETVQFGSLQLTARICWSRSADAIPRTTTFLEVDEVGSDSQLRRLFTGWMIAQSPGINAIEHAVYDVWLTDCKGATENDAVVVQVDSDEDEAPPPQAVDLRRNTPARPAQPLNRPVPNAQNAPLRLPGQGTNPTPPAEVRPQPQQRFFPTNQPIFRDPAGQGR